MSLASTSTAITGFSAAPTDDARAAVLDLYVADLAQLFDAMDLAPLGERDLDPKTDAFIVDWAQELPATQSLQLVIHLGKPSASGQDAAMVGEAVHEYYAHCALATRRRLTKLFRVGRISLLIGVVFVGVAAGIGEAVVSLFSKERYATLVHESVVIGAWVALWRPMEIFLYDWWPIRAEARLFERLSKLHVHLVAMGGQDGVPP
ncbi:hypothetical protein ISN76_09580 [Dyella halodurans]|uniref:Uncharacterized protein n=1 Tax=Dyella halodurans TaxID=1920171 RepID=A0ABV9C1V2_9GAMM|nr:hypothetical protein [Dyella halodurans]